MNIDENMDTDRDRDKDKNDDTDETVDKDILWIGKPRDNRQGRSSNEGAGSNPGKGGTLRSKLVGGGVRTPAEKQTTKWQERLLATLLRNDQRDPEYVARLGMLARTRTRQSTKLDTQFRDIAEESDYKKYKKQ